MITIIFSINNWTPVTIKLWDGLLIDTRLPLLLIGAFLIGIVPYFILHRATRWSLRRKLTNVERTLAETRGGFSPTVAAPQPISSQSVPIAVPPGVA
ncbi:MAG: LapA family protein [Chakrabartia sp.]